jgi:hypothetical protein
LTTSDYNHLKENLITQWKHNISVFSGQTWKRKNYSNKNMPRLPQLEKLLERYSLCPDLPCVLGVAQIPSRALEKLIYVLDGLKYPCCSPSSRRIHPGLISSRSHALAHVKRPLGSSAIIKALAQLCIPHLSLSCEKEFSA